MNDDRELDRAIDVAAGALMAQEPSRALTHAVLTRVHENVKPSAHRVVSAAAAASVLLCVAVAVTMMYRSSQTLPPLPATRSLPLAGLPAIAEPSITVPKDVQVVRRSKPALVVRNVAPVIEPAADPSLILALEAEPITVAAIEVPRIEPEAPVLIEVLTIEQLTIEPLAASND